MGTLNVVSSFEALAGDTVQLQPHGLIRVTPPATPVMHPVVIQFYNYFVPYRILDPADGSFSWENFITGGEDGTYVTPPPRVTGVTVAKGSVADQCGITPGTRSYNTFAMKAYAFIWNHDFRDQQLQDEINIDTYDGTGDPLRVAWERDYFTSCRPDELLGPEVTLPIGNTAPVISNAQTGENLTYLNSVDGTQQTIGTGGANASYTGTTSSQGPLLADLSAAGAVNINDLREAFALQRYQEARNLYGARFTEYLRYLGISSSDARLQRPERISGGKTVINFSEVLNTAAGDGTGTQGPLGQLGGHGIAGIRGRRARYFCEEHGQIVTLMAARPRTMYVTTQHKQFDRTTKEDYWQRELQAIGMEEVYNRELDVDHSDPGGVFGFNNRYESFKKVPSRVSGDFRDTLDSWHMARDSADLGVDPALDSDFIECTPSNRIYIDTAADTDKLWCTIRNKVAVRSMLRKSTTNTVR